MAFTILESKQGFATDVPECYQATAMAAPVRELVIAADDIGAIRQNLLDQKVESCAILYAHQTERTGGGTRLLVHHFEYPTPADYSRQGQLEAELRPEFVAKITKHARNTGTALIFVHSHLGTHPPVFSPIDDFGEARLANFLSQRHPANHAALVLSAGGTCSRLLGEDEYLRVVSLGHYREVLFDPNATEAPTLSLYDRQVRAFGSAGQSAIQQLRIAIIGLGGTGSIITQQLVHLGVRDFILIDPDVVETTNLNRVANASITNVGLPKIEVAAEYIRKISNDAKIKAVQGDVTQSQVARSILDADLIFGCTDSHGSRAVIQQISYQYLVPCIDLGTVIVVVDHKIRHIIGRVQLLAPGLACFTCSGLLNPAEVRRDMMTPFERQQDPYLQGVHEPAPAVMPINGIIASLATTMFLSFVAGVPVSARHLLYNGLNSTLRSARADQDQQCFVCSREGAFARGNSWPLLARQD